MLILTYRMTLIEQLKLYIPKFLTQKKTVVTFLVLVVLLCIFFVVVYKPIGLIANTGFLSFLSYRLYSIILVLVGLVSIAASRKLLYMRQQRKGMQLHQYFIWLGIELVALVVLLTAAAWLLNERKEVLLMDLVGRVVVDTVAVLTIPYIVTILIFLLQQKRLEIANLTNMLKDSKAVAEEAKVDTVMQFFDKGDHLVFVTKRSNVLYIEAADNYTVVHYLSGDKEDTIILHNSMKNMEETFASEGMVRCHRGYLVNLENVKYLRKEKDGLVLEMAYCDRVIPISKTYADDVVRQFVR